MKENVLMGSPLISTNESGTESLIGLYFRDASQNNLLTSNEEARLSRKLSRCYQAIIEEMDFPSDTPLTFQKTVSQISNTAPLSKRAKRAICLAWACREKLINANLRLSVHIARRYTQTGVPMSDLIQDANVGLIKAVDRFDPSKGYKFSTYAFWWINEEVNLHSQKGNRVVKIPENALNEVKAFNKQSIILYQKLGRAPNQTEIAESIGTTIERVGDLRSFLSSEVSTSTPVAEESSTSFGDTLEADEGSRPEERIKVSQTALMIDSILGCLGAREKEIVMRRFGLITGREETLQEISDSLQVSRERVRQIEKASIKKLKSISLQSPEIIIGLDVQERSKTYH